MSVRWERGTVARCDTQWSLLDGGVKSKKQHLSGFALAADLGYKIGG
jgi:hypothetical protein